MRQSRKKMISKIVIISDVTCS